MQAFGTRLRGALAATLSAALILSGALLTAPAAYAEDAAPSADSSVVAGTAGAETSAIEEDASGDSAAEDLGAEGEEVKSGARQQATEPEADAPNVAGFAAAGALDAAAASVTASVTKASTTSVELTFNFENVAASTLPRPQNSGVYVALTEAGTTAPIGSGQFVPNALIVQGAGTASYAIDPSALDRTKHYEAIVWYAHGNPTPEAMVARAAVDITAAQWDQVFPKVWQPAFTVELADGTPLAAGDTVYKGDQIVVKGTGFDPAANVGGRGMPIPNTLPQGSYVTFGKFATEWRPSAGIASSARKAGPQGWVLTEDTLNQVPSNFQSIVRGQWVSLAADGSWTAELTLADPKDAALITAGSYGVYTYGAGGVNNADQELALKLNYVDSERPVVPVWQPEITVFQADGVTPLDPAAPVYNGDKLVVKGTGFDPAANVGGRGMPIPSTLPQGSYVVFGKFADVWKPSAAAPSSTRKAGPQGWVLTEDTLNQVPSNFQSIVRGQWVSLAADGSWTAELTLADPKDAATVVGSYGVFTYGAGGVNNADQELEFRVNYQGDRPVGPVFSPQIEVFEADGVTPYTGAEVKEGDTLVVKGSGFDPYVNKCSQGELSCALGGTGRPIPNDKPQGTFVVFGNFASDWKPSAGIDSSQRKMDNDNRGWALAADTFNNDVPAEYRETLRPSWVELDSSTGSFTWTVQLKEPAELVQGGSFGIYTYAGGVSTKNSAQELSVPINFAGKDRPTDPGTEVEKGDLNWGVKASFREYVEGGAQGQITLLGGATRAADGSFNFVAGSEADWDEAKSTGVLAYTGGVDFSGHQGGLALTLENPKIEVLSASKAVLSARVDHASYVALADVDLSSATRTVKDGIVTWSGATTTMRDEGFNAFLGFYPVGSALDPVTFSATAAPISEDPALSPIVNETANSKIDVAITGTGFGEVKPLPGQSAPHVYVAIVEQGIDLSTVSQAGATSASATVVDGSFSVTLTEAALNLDRTKSYEVISWPSRSLPSEQNIYARAALSIDWAKLFPKPKPEGNASVVSSSTAGLVVRGALTKVDPADYRQGVKASVVALGTANSATALLGGPVAVSVPASGAFSVDVAVPANQLDRTRQYELVVWSAEYASPARSNIVQVMPFNVTTAEWNQVFPSTPTAPGAGSLEWGISTPFNDYINGPIAKGKVSTSGVGGGRSGYLFPQASSSSWNAQTRTGSVQFRGSVNYWGHSGEINMTFADPVITVMSPLSGSISAGGQTFPLNLAVASFRENADGSVSWSGVPVSGAISGSGNGGGGSVAMDSLSFTVGSASAANFGSTVTVSPAAQKREPAATAPATTGITVVTPAAKLVAGGEIEITASGFQPNETGILVVMYSSPTVLDDNAKADANGVVRWIGKLPKDLVGKHTITLQGSINVGHEITVLAADAVKKTTDTATTQDATTTRDLAAAASGEVGGGVPMWVWWTGALALLVIAGAATGLVVAQRRKASEAPTHL